MMKVEYHEIGEVGEMPKDGTVRAWLAGIGSREAALAWGRKQAERLEMSGCVYWIRKLGRVYFFTPAPALEKEVMG